MNKIEFIIIFFGKNMIHIIKKSKSLDVAKNINLNSIEVNKTTLIYYSKTFENLVNEFPEEENLSFDIPEEYQSHFESILSFLNSTDIDFKTSNAEALIYLVNYLELKIFI